MNTAYDYIPKINARIEERLEYMTLRHCKVLFVRLDLRFPENYCHNGRNTEISHFMKTLMEHYDERDIRVHYIWVREQATSPLPHYHIALFVNGSKIQNPMGIWMKAQEIWSRLTGGPNGLVDFCCHDHQGQPGSGSIMIRRPSGVASGEHLLAQQQSFEADRTAALDRASYLAKTYSKDNTPHGVRMFGASQL